MRIAFVWLIFLFLLPFAESRRVTIDVIAKVDSVEAATAQSPEVQKTTEDTPPEAKPGLTSFVLTRGGVARSDIRDRSLLEVDETFLQARIRQTLFARGFHEAEPGEEPDLLILFHYGRGVLRPPVELDESGIMARMAGSMPGDPRTVIRAFPDISRGLAGFRIEEERIVQDYEDERYFIILSAYDFAAAREKRRVRKWTTQMNVLAVGVGFTGMVDALLTAGMPHLGTVSDGRIQRRLETRTQVEIGVPEVIGIESP